MRILKIKNANNVIEVIVMLSFTCSW